MPIRLMGPDPWRSVGARLAMTEDALPPSVFNFAAINLNVGDRMQLRPPPVAGLEQLNVRLLGFKENVSVMTSAPALGRWAVREGEEIWMRVLSGIHAFSFKTSVLKICKTPFDYLHLSFPREVIGVAIRKAPRIQTRIPGYATCPESNESVSCTIADLSVGGMLVLSQRACGAVGQTLRLNFHFSSFGEEVPVEILAAIRSVDERKTGNGGVFFSHGMEFLAVADEQKMLIGSFLYQRLVDGETAT